MKSKISLFSVLSVSLAWAATESPAPKVQPNAKIDKEKILRTSSKKISINDIKEMESDFGNLDTPVASKNSNDSTMITRNTFAK